MHGNNLQTFWDHSWVHECGKSEVRQDEEGDESLYCEHPWVRVNVIVAPKHNFK